MNHAEFNRVREEMDRLLHAEHKKRQVRIDNDVDWIELEAETMHEAVNVERARRGLLLVPYSAITRVDAMATGHWDYARKFALYCAELAMGVAEVKP